MPNFKDEFFGDFSEQEEIEFMATESSKFVAYVPKQLYECLEQLKDERSFHSVSQAVNAVLAD